MAWTCKMCRRRWSVPRKYCPVCGEEWVPAHDRVYMPTKEEQKRRASAYRRVPVEACEYHVSNVADGLVHRKVDQLVPI